MKTIYCFIILSFVSVYNSLNVHHKSFKEKPVATITQLKPGNNKNSSGKIIKSPCIIKKFITIDNKPYIIVDFTTLAGSSEVSKNPLYENKNKDRLRIFLLTENTIIRATPTWRNVYGRFERISLSEFLQYQNYQISDYTKWNIVAKDGIVLELKQIYFA